MNHDIYRIIGNAFELLAYSNLHCEYNVYYIFNYVFVPAKQKNIHVYYNEYQHPVAYFSWGLITSDVQSDLTNDRFIMTSDDWNSGQRLYIHDLVAPWGGGAYIVRDIKYRFFPFVLYGFGIRRKKTAKPRIGVFFTNRTNVILHDDLNQAIDKMSKCFENIEYVLKYLKIMLGEYELKYSLDINDELNIVALRKARYKYHSIMKHVEIAAKLMVYNEEQNVSLLNYLHNMNKINKDVITGIEHVELVMLPEGHDEQIFLLTQYEFMNLYKSYIDCLSNNLCYSYDSLISSVIVDTKYSCDKIKSPFCSLHNHTGKVYIYALYDGGPSTILNHVHELSHALNYLYNSVSSKYLDLQHNVVVNEVIAMLHEFCFVSYIEKINFSVYNVLCKHLYEERRDREYSVQGHIHENAWRLAKKLYTKLCSYEHAKGHLCMLMKMNGELTLDKLVAYINSIDKNIEPL